LKIKGQFRQGQLPECKRTGKDGEKIVQAIEGRNITAIMGPVKGWGREMRLRELL